MVDKIRSIYQSLVPTMETNQQFSDFYGPLYNNPFSRIPSSSFTDNFRELSRQQNLLRQNLQALGRSFPVQPNTSRVVDPSKFQFLVNVKNFKESEVDVRIVGDFVVVSAKHEEQPDEGGFISRSFTRRFKLPDDVDAGKVTSSLNRDGVLTIKAPRKMDVPPAFEGGRIVSIETEQPRVEMEGNPVPKIVVNAQDPN